MYGISSVRIKPGFKYWQEKKLQNILMIILQPIRELRHFYGSYCKHAKEEGYVVTPFGRRRPVPELSSSNFMQSVRSVKRVAMNAPIQGTAADIIKIAMIRVNRRLKDQKMKSRLVPYRCDELL